MESKCPECNDQWPGIDGCPKCGKSGGVRAFEVKELAPQWENAADHELLRLREAVRSFIKTDAEYWMTMERDPRHADAEKRVRIAFAGMEALVKTTEPREAAGANQCP